MSTCNELRKTYLFPQFFLLTISKLKAVNNNKSFYRLIVIISDDISCNLSFVYSHHSPNLKEWNKFKIKRLHILHLNVNSLLPKVVELKYIAKLNNAAVIGMTESKLNDNILDSEIQIDNQQMFGYYGNRKDGGVACYVRKDRTKHSLLKKLRTYSLRSFSRKLNL